jgi:predicted nucleic acid-binding protein
MVEAFLDSSVVIDLIRQHLPAKQWILEQTPAQLGVTHYVCMEVLFGAPDKHHQSVSEKLLAQFTIVYPTNDDLDWARRHLAKYRLSHNVGVLDCLIAAPAFRLGLPLYTTNIKHFKPLLGGLAKRPY